jgi:UDP-N-acetyl-D-glucosamine/UDP-N-acetyl-D-galactosamine dehydrogenase
LSSSNSYSKIYDLNVDIYDPWADPEEVAHEYDVNSMKSLPRIQYDAVVLAVKHKTFESIQLDSLLKQNSGMYDVKAVLPKAMVDGRL